MFTQIIVSNLNTRQILVTLAEAFKDEKQKTKKKKYLAHIIFRMCRVTILEENKSVFAKVALRLERFYTVVYFNYRHQYPKLE